MSLRHAITACLADLEHYASTHGPGPDQRLAELKAALTRPDHRLQRMWVNAPSTLQVDHAHHGRLLLVDTFEDTFEASVCGYHVDTGAVIGQQYIRLTLDKGWPQHLRRTS